MKELIAIGALAKELGVSTRTLRYYEQIGLIESVRDPQNGYRTYDVENTARLRQILLLRDLRIPLRQIQLVMNSGDARAAIEVFQGQIKELREEQDAMAHIERALRVLVLHLETHGALKPGQELHGDTVLSGLLEKLNTEFEEERTMKNKEEQTRATMNLKDVRMINLPPMTVACAHVVGENPEDKAEEMLGAFIKDVRLAQVKPDMRKFGFNNPASPDGVVKGYEFWVSIPCDMEVPGPLTKKEFAGGLYAAHAIPFGAFHEWQYLASFMEENNRYQIDFEPRATGEMREADPCLEEQLNCIAHLGNRGKEGLQLDLLLPIREK